MDEFWDMEKESNTRAMYSAEFNVGVGLSYPIFQIFPES